MTNKFPQIIRIEPSSKCNLKCIHCPTGQFTSHGHNMQWKLFQRIITELKEYETLLKAIVLYHGGEPFLNKHLMEMILESKTFENIKVKTNTNGMLLNDMIISDIIKSNLDEIEISIDGISSLENNLIRTGSNYDKIATNIKALCEMKEELNSSSPKITIVNGQFRNGELVLKPPDIPSYLLNEFANYDINIRTFYFKRWPALNLDSFNLNSCETFRRNHCQFIFDSITIRADGTVVPCCYDLTSMHPLGNVNYNSITEIWNGNNYRILRDSIFNGNRNKLCEICFDSYILPKISNRN